jgi:hypothetical protein
VRSQGAYEFVAVTLGDRRHPVTGKVRRLEIGLVSVYRVGANCAIILATGSA